MSSKLVDAGEHGSVLGISRASVYRRRSLGEPLPRAMRIGSLIRWRQEDIEAFVSDHLEEEENHESKSN